MSDELLSVSAALSDVDALLMAGGRATAWAWPTGFGLLDTYLGGGLRAGELCLLGGPQGLGKTSFVLQVARNVARAGGAAVVLSYEHDASTMLERLLALEGGELFGIEGPPMRRIREALVGGGSKGGTLEERLVSTPGGPEAVASLRSFGDRLLLHRSMGSATDLAAARSAVEAGLALTGRPPLVVVDYLQKVHVPGGGPQEERVTVIVEGLKDLALEFEVPVLAVAAADREGIVAGRRLRMQHLRGSSALAYEADVVLLLNEKYDIVARHHLVYDSTNAERFRAYAILSIEKNRSGLDHVDVQLRKQFEQSRFDTEAEPVPEQLVDERVFTQ